MSIVIMVLDFYLLNRSLMAVNPFNFMKLFICQKLYIKNAYF